MSVMNTPFVKKKEKTDTLRRQFQQQQKIHSAVKMCPYNLFGEQNTLLRKEPKK